MIEMAAQWTIQMMDWSQNRVVNSIAPEITGLNQYNNLWPSYRDQDDIKIANYRYRL